MNSDEEQVLVSQIADRISTAQIIAVKFFNIPKTFSLKQLKKSKLNLIQLFLFYFILIHINLIHLILNHSAQVYFTLFYLI